MKKVILILAILIFTNPVSASKAAAGEPVLGPYSGKVIDMETREPVEGAVVLLYWVKEVPRVVRVNNKPLVMGTQLELVRSELQYTNAKGKYKIKPFYAGPSGHLERVQIVIYQRGYKAYLRDIQHQNLDNKPDLNFKNTGNQAVLERIPPYFDHEKHYEAIENALRGIEWIKHANAGDEQNQDQLKQDDIDRKAFLHRAEVLRRAEWERVRGSAGRRYQ